MTFSLLGFCPRTGMMGGVMATSSIAAGGRVMFGDTGLGVVFVQARSDPRLAPVGLAALRSGGDAAAAVAAMAGAAGQDAGWRQLAVLDLGGRVAGFTGEHCMAPKGEALGAHSVSVANAAATPRVIPAMVEAFEAASGALPDRLLAGLDAGIAEGGELYPLRSGGLMVFKPGIPFPWVNLRADCHEDPAAELRRMWRLWAPMADGYAQRTLDPANAPPAAALEGHQETPP
jgi:uncharacterized Ntn-hydrolase superfamily protein